MSWWNPFDSGRYNKEMNEAIFNLLSNKDKVEKAEEAIKGFLDAMGEQTTAKRKILAEIKRLKKDKWDDEGFDRLYELVQVEVLEDPEVK